MCHLVCIHLPPASVGEVLEPYWGGFADVLEHLDFRLR